MQCEDEHCEGSLKKIRNFIDSEVTAACKNGSLIANKEKFITDFYKLNDVYEYGNCGLVALRNVHIQTNQNLFFDELRNAEEGKECDKERPDGEDNIPYRPGPPGPVKKWRQPRPPPRGFYPRGRLARSRRGGLPTPPRFYGRFY